MDETYLVIRDIQNVMDRHILIAEVHKRPQLWNWTSPMYNDRIPEIWKEVAQIMGVDGNFEFPLLKSLYFLSNSNLSSIGIILYLQLKSASGNG